MSSHSSSSSSSSLKNLGNKATMDFVQKSEHLCYVRCNFCNTVLAVEIPCKRVLDTVTVKCGHCSNLSFLSTTRPPPPFQIFFSDFKKGQSPSSSLSNSGEPLSNKAPFVVKPPEKKHRLPYAYDRFMNGLGTFPMNQQGPLARAAEATTILRCCRSEVNYKRYGIYKMTGGQSKYWVMRLGVV